MQATISSSPTHGSSSISTNPTFRFQLLILLTIFFLRLVSLGTFDVIDTSDSRYAQIAQQMAISDSYIMPQIEQGRGLEPYWSKPPLAFWLSAGSMKVFGYSAWSARLPTLLVVSLTCLLLFIAGRRLYSELHGMLAALIYATTAAIFFLAGSTMIDPLLAFCTTGVMVCFGLAILRPNGRAIDLFGFAFAGLGVLVKGPIALIFPLLSLFLFVVVSRSVAPLKKIHWVSGTVLFLAISVPWFYVAESYSPGFVRYFLMEENYNRLVSSKLKLTSGVGHRTPFGMVWLFFPMMTAPWILLAAFKIKSSLTTKWHVAKEGIFLLTWMLAPLLMLTVGKQVLATYTLPAIPAFALLFPLIIIRDGQFHLSPRFLLPIFWISVVLIIGAICISPAYRISHGESFFSVELLICSVIAIGTLSFLSVCFPFWSEAKRESLFAGTRAVFVSALLMAIAFAAITFGAKEPINDLKSTLSLLSYIAADSSNTGEAMHTLQFLERVPQSAIFYTAHSTHFQTKMLRSKQFEQATTGYLILREKDLKQFPSLKHENWKKFGKWIFLAKDKA